MAILTPCIVTSKTLKGGKNKVRIAVAHNGQTRYIVTDIVLNSNNEFRNGVIVKRPDAAIMNTRLRKIMMRYQTALDDMEYVNGLTCPELVFQLLNNSRELHHTLTSLCNEYIDNSRIKQSTAKCYLYNMVSIEKYFGSNFFIGNITHASILGFDSFLRKKGLKPSSVRNIMITLKSLINYATRCGYVTYKVDPFFGYKMPEMQVKQSWLSVDQIKIIRDVEIKTKGLRRCRDFFMLSYYLGGINAADLVRINFNENKKMLCYERQKTENKAKVNKYVEFCIPEEAWEIINRYKDADGFINISAKGAITVPSNYFGKRMRVLEKITGIKTIIYYSARKSFAQHAFNLGISTSIIDYILGHKLNSGGTSLYSYIYVTPELATNAIRQVLDNLK